MESETTVKQNLPSKAGEPGSIPGWGTKIPYAVGQLSLHIATAEPAWLGPMLHNKRSHRREVYMLQLSSPQSPQLEKGPWTAKKTPHSQK